MAAQSKASTRPSDSVASLSLSDTTSPWTNVPCGFMSYVWSVDRGTGGWFAAVHVPASSPSTRHTPHAHAHAPQSARWPFPPNWAPSPCARWRTRPQRKGCCTQHGTVVVCKQESSGQGLWAAGMAHSSSSMAHGTRRRDQVPPGASPTDKREGDAAMLRKLHSQRCSCKPAPNH
jgi:hypothetical protein